MSGMNIDWRGRRVRDKVSGDIGKVTADFIDQEHDLLAVFFGPGRWNVYTPNLWSKDNLFDLLPEGPDVAK